MVAGDGMKWIAGTVALGLGVAIALMLAVQQAHDEDALAMGGAPEAQMVHGPEDDGTAVTVAAAAPATAQNNLVPGKQTVDIDGVTYSVVDADWMIHHLGCAKNRKRCKITNDLLGKKVAVPAFLSFSKKTIQNCFNGCNSARGYMTNAKSAGVIGRGFQMFANRRVFFFVGVSGRDKKGFFSVAERERCWDFCEYIFFGTTGTSTAGGEMSAVLQLDGFYHVKTHNPVRFLVTEGLSIADTVSLVKSFGD